MLRQVALAALVLSLPGLAMAQDDMGAAETAAARALAIEGTKLAEAGQCGEAVKKLERAEKLHHSQIVLSRMGDCLVQLGRLVEGSEVLRKMLREPMPSNASPALKQAYERAQSVLDATKPRLAMLTINVDMPPNVDAVLSVDGNTLPSAVIGTELPSDPGEHVIEVSAKGFLKASARVTLTSGERETATLRLERDPNAPVAPPPSAAAPAPAPASEPAPGIQAGAGLDPQHDAGTRAEPNRTPAYIALGLGAVGLGIGIGFGAVAMNDKSKLDDECSNGACPPSSSDRLDRAKTMGNIATVGFGVAGAGALVGTILLLNASSNDAATAPRARRAAFRPRAFVGLGNVVVTGEF